MTIKSKNKKSTVIAVTFAVILSIWFGKSYWDNFQIETEKVRRVQLSMDIRSKLDKVFQNGGEWPLKVKINDSNLNLKYTFNPKLEKYVKKLLKRYRSDYSSVIIIDNKTGRVLTALGYERKGNKFNFNLPFSSTHPAASLFKIISSAALLESGKLKKDTIFKYRGRGTTLYKYQLKEKKSRWTRKQTFQNAFAYSNNVIFGKAAINNITEDDLYKRAVMFGFNQDLMTDISLSKSQFLLPHSQYNLAEKASGFNKKTLISPVHGALFSSIIANKGILKQPYIVEEVEQDGKTLGLWDRTHNQVLGKKASRDLRELMKLTVKKGTARGSFRRMKRSLKRKLEIGGKTGSITGGFPYGKRDWFTSFAVPKDSVYGDGISICVMNVNVEKWYVKSTFLAKNIIEYYYKHIIPLNIKLSKSKQILEKDKV